MFANSGAHRFVWLFFPIRKIVPVQAVKRVTKVTEAGSFVMFPWAERGQNDRVVVHRVGADVTCVFFGGFVDEGVG